MLAGAHLDQAQTADTPRRIGGDGRPTNPSLLAETRVLDLTGMWSGPYCTSLLADLGADVAKVEVTVRMDGMRASPHAFRELNHNKHSVLLDLRDNDDRALFLRLAGAADVLVENFSPRVMTSFGFSYDALSAINPSLVMLSMPAFGSRGPQSNWVAFGWELEAMGGLMALTRDASEIPVSTGVPLADPTAGVFGALAVLAALWRRRAGGCGCHIDLAQRDAVLQLVGDSFVAAETYRDEASPSGCFPCLDDRWVALSVRNDCERQRLIRAIGREELVDEPAYATSVMRHRLREAVDTAVREFTRSRPAGEVVLLLREIGVPAALVANEREVNLDPKLIASGFWRRLHEHVVPLSSPPWRSSLLQPPELVDAPSPDSGRDALLEDWLT